MGIIGGNLTVTSVYATQPSHKDSAKHET